MEVAVAYTRQESQDTFDTDNDLMCSMSDVPYSAPASSALAYGASHGNAAVQAMMSNGGTSSGGSSTSGSTGYQSPLDQPGLYVSDPSEAIPEDLDTGTMCSTNGMVSESYLEQICPEADVTVDPQTGRVSMSMPDQNMSSATSPHAQSCEMLSEMVNTDHHWEIKLDDQSWPHTEFGDDTNAGNGVGTGGVVTAPTPNSPKLWGAATQDGNPTVLPNWMVLGHELLGHGRSGDQGMHDSGPQRGEGGHQQTVQQENILRDEHGLPLRGGHLDPYCGESFYINKDDPNQEVHWSNYLNVCQAWRQDYNQQHGTSYDISDDMP